MAHFQHRLLYLLSVQDWRCRVHVQEEALRATLDQFLRQEIGWSGVGWRSWRACIISDFMSQVRQLLRLPELGDDFCPAALWTFLLRYGIVSAGESGLTAVYAWLAAIATNLR